MQTEHIDFELYNGKVKGRFYPNSHAYYIDGKRKTGVTTYINVLDKSRPLMIWATELFRDFLLAAVQAEPSRDELEELIYKGCTLHEEKKQEASSIGDKVHAWIEAYVKGEQPEMPTTKESQIGVNAFLDWENANKVKFLSSERVVYSRKHDYIGKMDIEAKVNGKRCLIDIKTSNALYNTYGMQTAAYARADEEENEKKYAGRWLIRLAKETEAEYLVRMERKNLNRQRNGKDPINFPPYQVFEAKYLDEDKASMERDFKAFINAKALFEWNKATDFFLNKN